MVRQTGTFRAHQAVVRLTPPRRLTLEQALGHTADDECVEVAPSAVRVRTVTLATTERARSRRSGPKRGGET
ncbi:MAG: hypothetical protein E6G01_18155 [Actinobacteria bacterium]|nr:MAG: hypothetical protein E6G01_18155 [Actinomycetota bacterium]